MPTAFSKLAIGAVTAAACLMLPAMAFAGCEQVAGEHHGRFSVDKREDSGDSGRPDYVSGTWTATIDGTTCAVTGEADSDLTGKVALTGTYDASAGGKFKVTNLSLQADSSDFIEFSFSTDTAKRLLRYVVSETAQYRYVGDFDGK